MIMKTIFEITRSKYIKGAVCAYQRALSGSYIKPYNSVSCFGTNSGNYNNGSDNQWLFPASSVAGLLFASGFIYWKSRGKKVTAGFPVLDATSSPWKGKYGEEIPGLPVYTLENVADHSTKEKGIWVTFGSGVYDISGFIEKHPGGDRITMAAGGSLEPFWELYAVHKTEQVLGMLEKYRIGNLSVEDRNQAMLNVEDPYANEPKRHPALKPSSKKPFNAEPPLNLLVEKFLTPNELFYVRNHLPVPQVDPKEYELEIEGIGIKAIYLSLDDIKTKFPKCTITSTIQCAGNRRSELNEVKEVKGLSWGAAAIGTAEWSGAKLVDVLRYAGVNFEDESIKHVQFEGLDTDIANVPYGASIPAHKAFDPRGDVILAYEMNGQPLSPDHGYPVRVVVPGIVGARNVKWVGKITLSDEESDSHWQRRDYKGFSPSVDWKDADFDKVPSIQELPVVSAICYPLNNETVKLRDGCLTAKGYAWSGGGRKIIRVDVSMDEGKTWKTATLNQLNTPLNHSWAWAIWEVCLPVPEQHRKDLEIICKAVDSSYNVQPETFAPIWNIRGVLGNAWHRVKVKIE